MANMCTQLHAIANFPGFASAISYVFKVLKSSKTFRGLMGLSCALKTSSWKWEVWDHSLVRNERL